MFHYFKDHVSLPGELKTTELEPFVKHATSQIFREHVVVIDGTENTSG
jgi:hypothetical protein